MYMKESLLTKRINNIDPSILCSTAYEKISIQMKELIVTKLSGVQKNYFYQNLNKKLNPAIILAVNMHNGNMR